MHLTEAEIYALIQEHEDTAPHLDCSCRLCCLILKNRSLVEKFDGEKLLRERDQARLADIMAGCDIQRGDRLYRQVPVVIGPGKTEDQLEVERLQVRLARFELPRTETGDDICLWLREQEEVGCLEAAGEIEKLREDQKELHILLNNATQTAHLWGDAARCFRAERDKYKRALELIVERCVQDPDTAQFAHKVLAGDCEV